MNLVDFNKGGGLVPAIVQDAETGDVLMLGYMNEASLKRTLELKQACFYSRSREKLWVKGETSGHVQKVKEIFVDCDRDTILLKVEQVGGAACHTGYRSCFFQRLEENELKVVGERVFDPREVYGE
jgi:phosphoribosyl-AMP cyclohydrolase